jgi:hypothetical protein
MPQRPLTILRTAHCSTGHSAGLRVLGTSASSSLTRSAVTAAACPFHHRERALPAGYPREQRVTNRPAHTSSDCCNSAVWMVGNAVSTPGAGQSEQQLHMRTASAAAWLACSSRALPPPNPLPLAQPCAVAVLSNTATLFLAKYACVYASSFIITRAARGTAAETAVACLPGGLRQLKPTCQLLPLRLHRLQPQPVCTHSVSRICKPAPNIR